MSKIFFNRPNTVGNELEYLKQAIDNSHLSGDGDFTRRCHQWLETNIGGHALLTHSCTAALEMGCLLANLQPGDEVIMPSYTFVSTANAVALRGAVPVFIDIREDTLNLNESLIESAITSKTKAIIPVHYAGVIAEMDRVNSIAKSHDLFVIEDAAQALLSTYHGRLAGTLGHAAAFSFHETKNVLSGEGGALIVKDIEIHHRAEIIREKGTNRSRFFRGEVDKYSWVDIGSSYLPSELIAAFLAAQLEQAREITQYRLEVCEQYRQAFTPLSRKGQIRLPIVPSHCTSNGHMFYLLLESMAARDSFIAAMKDAGIMTPFHYVPLHSSEAGVRLSRTSGPMNVTNDASARLVRLPVYYGVKSEQDRIIDVALKALQN
ncbi:MAG: dTDP-4-amino-4,6-dideoxygalactose transaminase [Pseudomonadota bacterium]